VDTGYLDAALLVASQKDFGVALLGPTRPDLKWQAKAGQGLDVAHFPIDWDKQEVTCPQGQTSRHGTPMIDNRRNQVIKIKFASSICRACPRRTDCIRSEQKYPRRTITIRPEEQHQALATARQRAKTKEYAHEYARRAGIEGTLSRAIRTCGMRRSRYMGLPKVPLGNVLTALAINFLRLSEWLAETPWRRPRQSAFSKLIAVTA